jgi:hypothetical protein
MRGLLITDIAKLLGLCMAQQIHNHKMSPHILVGTALRSKSKD